MHFVKCKMLTILGKFSKIQERFKIKTSEYNHGKKEGSRKNRGKYKLFFIE